MTSQEEIKDLQQQVNNLQRGLDELEIKYKDLRYHINAITQQSHSSPTEHQIFRCSSPVSENCLYRLAGNIGALTSFTQAISNIFEAVYQNKPISSSDETIAPEQAAKAKEIIARQSEIMR